MKRVGIFYATRQGHTQKVVERVAAALESKDIATELHNVAVWGATELSLAPYDAIVLAGSVQLGKHERELVEFARSHREQLERMPTSFLTVSLAEGAAEDTSRPNDTRDRAAAEVRAAIEHFVKDSGWHPRHVKPVAGALLYRHYNFILRFMMKQISRHERGPTDTSRDHVLTDWSELDHWTLGIAAELNARKAS